MLPVQLERGINLHRLINSELISKYPESVAKQLFHIGKIPQNPGVWNEMIMILDTLSQSDLDQDTRMNIKELIAEIGGP